MKSKFKNPPPSPYITEAKPSKFASLSALLPESAHKPFRPVMLIAATILMITSLVLPSKIFAQTGQSIDSWVSMANAVPTGNNYGACIVYAEQGGNSKIYNIRGSSTGFGIYDINSNVWVSTTPLPYSSSNGASMTWDGGNFIYMLLGGTTFYQYDISASTFTRLPDPPATVTSGAAIVYVSTQSGINWCYAYQGGTTAFWRYDINTSSWITRQSQTAATGAGAALLWTGDNFIYGFIGGSNAGFRRYDINTDAAWTSLTNVPQTIGAGGSLVWDGVITSSNIYAFRGNSDTPFFKYNISANQWVYVSSAPLTIGTYSGNRLARVGDYIYGRRGVTSDDFWRYRWRDVNSPGPITELVAKTGTNPGGIDLSWTSPGNDGYAGNLPAGSTFYIQYASWTGVNFSTATQPPFGGYDITIPTGPVTPGTSVYYTIGGLLEGVTYYFRIWTKDNAGQWSGISVGATSWAQISPPATAPNDLASTSQSSATISLSWSLSGAATYWVEHSSVPSPYNWVWRSSVPAPGNTYTDIDLIPGVTYWHRLIALNAAGVPNYGSPSNIASTITYTAAPVSFTKISVGTTTIKWSWTPNGYADGYRIYQATSPNTLVATIPFGTNTFEETGLSTNTAYGRFVRAYNIMGESLDSNHATFYTLAAAPQSLDITAVYQSSVTLVWQNGGNPDGTIYGLARAEDAGFTVNHTTIVALADGLTALTTVAVNLGGNTTYYFRVWAYNGEGVASAYSNIASTSTPSAPPAAPSNLYGVAISSTIIKWEWDITSGATYYRIYASPGDTFLANLNGNGATTWIEIGLSSNTQYTRYVKAGNDQGLSGASNSASRYTLAYPPTTLSAVAASSSTINLSWNFSGATKYEVWYSTDLVNNNLAAVVNSPTITYSHQGLEAGVTYFYQIMPVNGNDVASYDYSFPQASTRTLPSPVVNLTTSAITPTSITWTWSPAIGADGYLILMATSPSTVVGQTSDGVTSFTSQNLSTNTAYGRYVRAYNTSGAGILSPSATFYTAAATPGIPVVDGVTTNSVSLSWSANSNPSGTRYGVARSTDDFVTVVTTVSTYSDALTNLNTTVGGLSQNTTYQFRVWAYNGDAVATTFTTSVSTKTNALSVVTLINESFEGTFPPDGWWTNDASTGAIQASDYKRTGTYSVKFDNANDVLRTPMLGNPITLNFWLRPGTSLSSTFSVQRATATTGPWTTILSTGGAEVSTFTEQTLDLSGLTNIYIKFQRTGGTGNFHVDDVIITGYPDTLPPSAISDLTALAGAADGEIKLAWSAPSGDDGTSNPLTGGYIIKYSSVQIINSADFDAPSFVHNTIVISTSGVAPNTPVSFTLTLTPGASYWFAIKSTDTAGNLSVWKSSADVPTVNTLAYGLAQDLPPPAPANLTATANENIIQLNWDAVSVADLSHYELWCDSTSATLWDDSFIATSTVNTSYLHTGLENNVTYYYRVRAVDTPPNVLYGAYSNEVSTYPRPSPPFAPSLNYDLSATTTDSIKWVLTDNSGNEQNLYISSAADSGARLWTSAALAGTGGTTTWVETGFTPDQAVTRYAEASNAQGSNWSGAVTRYTRAQPPVNLSIGTINYTDVDISWSANGNPVTTRYEISISSDIFAVNFSTPIKLSDNYTTTTANISSLNQGTTYWIRARAFNGDDVATVFSSTVSFVTNRAPVGYLKISNPGFELSGLSGWTRISSSSTDPSQNSTYKRSGLYACKFQDPVSTFYPASSLRRLESSSSTITAGNDYQVGLWAYVVNEGAGVITNTRFRIGIKWVDNTGATLYTSTSTELTLSAFGTWEKISYIATAPAGADKGVMVIDVREAVDNNNDVYIDDVDAAIDSIPPAPVGDLSAAKGTNAGEIDITWTAPGDDGATGDNTTPAAYILKYATYPLVAASSWTWYNNAITYYQNWTVGPAASQENKTIVLVPGVTYYFLIRTQDASGNISEFDDNAMQGEGVQASACAKEGTRRGVVINEVAPDQTSGQGYDFIELYNPGPDTPDIFGWEFYDFYTQDTALEKVEGHWQFPANTYLVLRFNQTRSMTTPTQKSPGYYELATDKTGISQTDNVIMVSTGGVGATIIDMVCYADMSGSLTNSTRLRAAYNLAISTGQWFGPLSDGSNDAVVERYMASTLYNATSNWAIARNNYSTDGTNPSYMEWSMTYTTTRGSANNAFDSIAPAPINNLAVVPGDNRGTMRLTWTAVGDDGNTGTAAGYLLRYRTDMITADNFDASSNYDFASKDGQSDTDRWSPKLSGQSESYLIGGFTAGTTYYLGIKVQDERPNTSSLSNVVSTAAANIIGSNVRINEVYPAGLNAGDDWIEFYCARGPVNVNGWKILGIVAGGTSETTLKTLPNITLQTGDYLVFNCVAGTDETDTSGKGANGYWDVYGVQDLKGFDGVVTLKDNYNNIVDFVAYSQGTSAQWKTIWGDAVNWCQWSPASTDVVHAFDWTGGDATKSFGRDGFSTDTDDTLAEAKADWKVFATPSKGAQNDDIPPGAITNLSALTDPNVEGKIILTWTAPGDDLYSGNNSNGSYLIKYATYAVSGSSWAWWNSATSSRTKTSPSSPGSTEQQIFTGLYPGVTYYFAVRTVDDMSNWSALDVQIGSNDPSVQAQALAANLPPSAPSGVSAVSSNTVVHISWYTNPELDLKEYRVSSNTVDNFATASLVGITPATSTSISATGLTNGVTYYFWVQAVDLTDFVSSTSAVVSAVPLIRPPSGLTSNHRGDYVNLAWTNSPDSGAPNFGGYVVYRSSVSAVAGFNIVATLSGGTTHQDRNNVDATTIYYYFLRSSDTAGPLSYQTAVSTAIPDDKAPSISVTAPSVSPLVIEVKGNSIVFEADVADDQSTAYISGVDTSTVKINFVVGGSTITQIFDEVKINSYVSGSQRILSATFKTSLYSSRTGLNSTLKNILDSGGTFYYYIEARDGVGNYEVSTSSVVVVKEESKTSASISVSAGGTLSLTDGNPDDGQTSIDIPQGALPSDVVITIKQEDPDVPSTTVPKATSEPSIKTDINDKKPVAVYEFGPSGTIFKKPVTITLLYLESGGAIKNIAGDTIAGATEDDLRIYTYDGVKWNYVGGTIDKNKNTVTAKVSHFTLYALFASKGAPEKPQSTVKFITPNGDGINDFLNFEGSASDFKEITIYDINGKVVRKISDTNIWDARDDSGKPVEIGAYIWRAVYTDGKSNYGTVVVAR